MPATYVASSVRTAQTFGGAFTVDVAAATTGQTRVLIVNAKAQAVDFTALSGWTNVLNDAHPGGATTGRLGVWVKTLSAGESAGTVTVGRTGTPSAANLVSLVVDGTYKRLAKTLSSSWVAAHVCPSASLDTGDDMSVRIAASAEYQRTWTWGAGTEIADTASSGGPDVSVAHRAESGSSTGTVTATADSVEQSHAVTMVFAPIASGSTADLIGEADTVALGSLALTGGPVSVAAGGTADFTLTALAEDGTTPVRGVEATFLLQMPSGAASVVQLAVTDANGQATCRVTGTTAMTSGQTGTITAELAGRASNGLPFAVGAVAGARSVRVTGISATMVPSGATPTSGWFVFVHSPPSGTDTLEGAFQFRASGATLSGDGSGGLQLTVAVPGGSGLAVSDAVRVKIRRSDTVSASVASEESVVMIGSVIAA